MTKSIRNYVLGILSYIMGIQFLFCNIFMYCFSNILIRYWCIVTLIAIYYGHQKFHIVFISWVWHECSFASCVKLVQNISTALEYVKIARILDNWIIRNQRFLMIFFIICIFLFVYTFVDEIWFAVLSRPFINDNTFWFALIRRTDLR